MFTTKMSASAPQWARGSRATASGLPPSTISTPRGWRMRKNGTGTSTPPRASVPLSNRNTSMFRQSYVASIRGRSRAVAGEGFVARAAAAEPQRLVDLGRATSRTCGDDQLHRTHRAGADLDLRLGAVVDQLLAADPGRERRIEAQDAVQPEHVR